MSQNPQPFVIGNTPSPCCQAGAGVGCGCCGPGNAGSSAAVKCYPYVTDYVGGLTQDLDAQYVSGFPIGLIIETAIGGFSQKWQVQNLGANQQTEQDDFGNYTIIRMADTAASGLCLVALN